MRIVQAAGWYFPNTTGGTEIYVSELSRRLRDAGHEVLIAAPDALADRARTYDHEGTPVYRFPIAARATREEAQGRVAVRGAEQFHEWLARVRPDVVHMHTFVTGMALPEIRAARSAGARVIATTHSASFGFLCQRGSMMRWGKDVCGGRVGGSTCIACYLDHRGVPRPFGYSAALVPQPLSAAARKLPGRVGTFLGMKDLMARNRSAQHEALELVERFVVLTEFGRRVLLENGAPPDKIVVNRLGVRFAPLPPAGRSRSLKIAYVGRYDPIKGVEDLARAIGSLPESIPLEFEFYGPVTNSGDLEVLNRVKAHVRGGAWTTFGSQLDTAGVQALMTRIDVMCCPSRVVEGGPTVALEANAAGVPVIGCDVPALSEIVKNGTTGRLVPPGDWRALAAAFRELAGAPDVVAGWRTALPPVRTMDDVTREYLPLYGA